MVKMVGKNAKNFKLGFGAFTYWDIPVNEIGNRSLRIELLDFAYFPAKTNDQGISMAYVSIKLGYRYIFSAETKTGFYVEPQVGYCRVVVAGDAPQAAYGDGVAAAAEFGYTLEVGERGNSLNFGLKYEADMAGANYKISSVGLRLSYSFHMFGKRGD
jgi:hypothetical protein